MFKLLRPLQWLKNGFVLAPLLFGLKAGDSTALARTFAAAAIFSLVASAVYIVNDWRDMADDRAHPRKRMRPLASGAVGLGPALVVALVLSGGAAAIYLSAHLPASFASTLLVYAALSLAYSFGLKRVALLELFIVASGYVLRVLAGCQAADVPPSQWLFGTTATVALLLVTGKRRAEMAENVNTTDKRRSLDGYTLEFLDTLLTITASITVMTYMAFTLSDEVIARYGSENLLLSGAFVAFGVFRYMQIVKVGRGADSPTELVISDPGIAGAVIGWLLFMAAKIYL